jgi:hypothetical protein
MHGYTQIYVYSYILLGILKFALQSLNTEKSEFAYQSILNKCGYSVSQKSSLSSDDRIILLRSIIDNNILSREAIKSFINWLINFHGANPLMKDALAEWKTDLHALATDSRAPIIRVRSIKG